MDGYSTIYYALYPSNELKSSKQSLAALTTIILSNINNLLNDFEFVWHKDSFELTLNDDNFLEGKMRVGESIEDEWVTVWLLKQLSVNYDLVIEIHDTDGQFLLIEAADHLPSWLTPTRAENRLWVYKDRLHLIPLDFKSPGIPKKRRIFEIDNKFDDLNDDNDINDAWIDLKKAIELVRDDNINTLAPQNVENAAFSRIKDYPSSLINHQHTFLAYLPSDLTKICCHTSSSSYNRSLACSLVQRSIEAFTTRDSTGTRATQKMSRFDPSNIDYEPVSITVTRTAYAQMQGQRFYPPRVFHSERWPNSGYERDQRERGMKISCGFEILYDESKHTINKNQQFQQNNSFEPIDKNEFKTFIDKLKSVEFFNGEIEGSKKYNEKYEEAKRTWKMIKENKDSDDEDIRKSFAQNVETLINENEIPNNIVRNREDDESWINVDATDFDDYLSQRMSTFNDSKNIHDVNLQTSAETLGKFSDKLHTFVEGEGNMQSVRFENEEFSDEEDDNSENENENSVMTEEDKNRIMTNLVPSLQANEWGAENSKKNDGMKLDSKGEQDLINQIKSFVEDPEEQKKTAEDEKLRSRVFERNKYDGHSDSEDDNDDEIESRENNRNVNIVGEDEGEEEENLPQVEGDIDIDMGNEEDDFVKFSRSTLGIDDQLWEKIINDRKQRGVFIPEFENKQVYNDNDNEQKHKAKEKGKGKGKGIDVDIKGSFKDKGKRRADDNDIINNDINIKSKNDKLNSFEAVMEAMDNELKNIKGSNPTFDNNNNGNDDDDDEQLIAMDQELKSILARVDPNDETLESDDDDYNDLESGDYTSIKNFLESFKAQSGLSGPVSNLAGSLGERLPRDHQ